MPIEQAIAAILRSLSRSLTRTVCDGCSVVVVGEPLFQRADPRDAALAAIVTVAAPGIYAFDTDDHARALLPPAYADYIASFGLGGLAIVRLPARIPVVVSVARDRAFSQQDQAVIEACAGSASFSLDSALDLAAERSLMRHQSEEIAQFQEDLLRILGHDLRSSLAGILVGTEMLSSPPGDSASSVNVVTRIVSFANRLVHMADQVLDMTRARLGGGIPLARCNTHLAPLLRSVIEDVARTHPRQRFQLAGAEAVKGIWDPDRLGQAAANLLTNAAKYGLEGAPVTIAVEHSDGETTIRVHNELRDEPINPRALARMFDPCHGGSDHQHAGTGLGLGLYVAQQIVHAHGGTIVVESSREGTTFQIALPDHVAVH
ncbi:MAG TPA: HAMP domain-containing sensor histidine kinase [Kofleriaceae bacterium]|nr:HAMP domain-containing sensor histidine kinase [Kofleriaceae bacterium]